MDRIYAKWTGGFWRFISAAELGATVADRRMARLANDVLDWALLPQEEPPVNGRHRRHATQQGLALYAACLAGLSGDQRADRLAERLVAWQWPDGGWNCDPRPAVSHSSFHESLGPLMGLATQDRHPQAALAAAQFFLAHQLLYSTATGRLIHPDFVRLHWPAYWHYDYLQCLGALARLDLLADSRAQAALDLLESKRRPDGTWRAGQRYWRARGRTQIDCVDWGAAADVLTRHAEDVLLAAHRR